jgi:hypothetical protein
MTRRQLLLGVAPAPAYWVLRRVLRNDFVLTYESDQVVRDMTLEVCGEVVMFYPLRPDEAVTGRFGPPDEEAAFAIRGRYADGRAFAGTTGHVAREDVGRTFYLAVLTDEVTTRRVR